jgi:RING finger and CHY zinc finger domain-containing protein 1
MESGGPNNDTNGAQSNAEKIKSIMRDTTIAPMEKQRLIQAVLSGRNSDTPAEAPSCEYECTHYVKKCSKFFFQCCDRIDQCHRCHREQVSCSRPNITDNECEIRQQPSNSCIQCGSVFAISHCPICKIWTEKNIFHCDGCGLCRVGNRENYFHCVQCNGCFNVSSRDIHECVLRPMDEVDCPLCMEPIHSAQCAASVLECRHIVHQPCLTKSLRAGEYRCPCCRHSMSDMSDLWEAISASIAQQPMPEEMRVTVAYTCFDCQHKGDGEFHFLGIKCANCNGYNTAR